MGVCIHQLSNRLHQQDSNEKIQLFPGIYYIYCFSYCAIGVKAISEVMKWQPTATIAVPWSKLNAQALELHAAAASASSIHLKRFWCRILLFCQICLYSSVNLFTDEFHPWNMQVQEFITFIYGFWMEMMVKRGENFPRKIKFSNFPPLLKESHITISL